MSEGSSSQEIAPSVLPPDNKPSPPERPQKRGMLTVQQYQDRLKRRGWRTLDYASIGLSAAIIYATFLVADYLLMNLIEWLFRSEMASSPFLTTFFHSAKVGLALLAFILCVIHGVRGAWEQYQRDIHLSLEDEKPHV